MGLVSNQPLFVWLVTLVWMLEQFLYSCGFEWKFIGNALAESKSYQESQLKVGEASNISSPSKLD
jgi:hypothetical protein